MSRLGKKPVAIPDGVEVSYSEGTLRVKGPKGEMTQEVKGNLTVEVDAAAKQVWVRREGNASQQKAFHGLYWALLRNMVEGVSKGYTKELDIVGTGYRASIEGGALVMQIGFSHPVKMVIPEGLVVTCPSQTQVVVSGVDKQKVGNFAATARSWHPPDPYHQKGIRYRGEQVRKLTGKTFGSTAG
ncbi:MAG: 50S ribosomal protein L6 [Planctomycetota bacterium]|jgi:large subunit ribosomal protein L6